MEPEDSVGISQCDIGSLQVVGNPLIQNCHIDTATQQRGHRRHLDSDTSVHDYDCKIAKSSSESPFHFINQINGRTTKLCKTDNSLPKTQDLLVPKDERNPQLWKYNYFQGEKGLTRQSSGQVLSQKDRTSPRKSVDISDILADENRFTVIIGAPGSGKTTTLKRFGNAVVNKEIAHLEDISIIHLVDVSDLASAEGLLTIRKLLFINFVHITSDEAEKAMNWLEDEDNQKRCLLILDGLDQCVNWSMNERHHPISYDQFAKPSVLIRNLFSGHLYPSMKILAATRSHALQDYNYAFRPQTTIAMAGLTEGDAQYLFEEMLGDDGKAKWKTLSALLKMLCTTPLLLLYVAFICKSNPHFAVENISSILVAVIDNMLHRSGRKIVDKIKKLKEFALEKTKLQQTTFSKKDLKMFDLEQKGIDILISSGLKDRKTLIEPGIMDDDVNIFFSHVLIQETLASLEFLELPIEKYKDFIKSDLHQPHMDTVRQISCSILFNPTTRELTGTLLGAISKEEEKKKLMSESLKAQLQQSSTPVNKLSQIAALHEGQKNPEIRDILESSMNEIYLHELVLTMCDMQVISLITAACTSLSQLILYKCHLDESKLEVLWKNIENSSVKIELLGVPSNENISAAGLKFVGKTISHCCVKELDLHSCRLTADHMISLLGEIKHHAFQLKALYLRRNMELGSDGLKAVSEIAKEANIEKLDISFCNVSSSDLLCMAPNFRQLKTLLVTGNDQLDEAGMQTLGKVAAESEIKELHMNWCNLELPHLEGLHGGGEHLVKETPAGSKLLSLNISNNKCLKEENCFEMLCKCVSVFGVNQLDIHGCEFSEEQKKTLKQKGIKFFRMDTYYSMELGSKEFINLLKRNCGRHLDVSLNNTAHLESLPSVIEQHGAQFRKLCLSEGREATRKDIDVLLKILSYISEELWLRGWKINTSSRSQLQKGIDNLPANSELVVHFSANDKISRSGKPEETVVE